MAFVKTPVGRLLARVIALLEAIQRRVNEPQQQGPRAIPEQREPAHDADHVADQIDALRLSEVESIRELVNAYNAAQRESTRQQGKVFGVQVAIAIFTFLAFLAAAIYAEFAKQQKDILEQQWQAMNMQIGTAMHEVYAAERSADAAVSAADTAAGTLREMQKSGSDTHELAVQARNQAANTQTLANETREQVSALQRQTDAYSRAWVTLAQLPGFEVDQKTNELILVVEITNTGRTPAFALRSQHQGVETSCCFLTSTLGKGQTQHIYRGGVLAPNAVMAINSPTGLSSTHVEDGTEVFFRARFEYTDVSGHDHWTNMCFYTYQVRKAMNFCPVLNDTDDQPEKWPTIPPTISPAPWEKPGQPSAPVPPG